MKVPEIHLQIKLEVKHISSYYIDSCQAEESLKNFLNNTYNLEIRNADVKTLIHIGMPYNPNIGDKEGPKIPLKEQQRHQNYVSHIKN